MSKYPDKSEKEKPKSGKLYLTDDDSKAQNLKNDDLEKGKEYYENPEDDPDFDPWSMPELKVIYLSWDELTVWGKIKRVVWDYFLRYIFLLGFLYFFICSLDFMGSAFKLLGSRAVGDALADSKMFNNPIAGLMLGILATVLVQSSSTSTSIIVTMVGANLLTVQQAIYMVMGANIGTSITNTIVALGQITNKNEFRRAFAGATVHDMFNWATVFVFLPLEAATGYLHLMTKEMINSMDLGRYDDGKRDFLKTITKPFTNLVLRVDKSNVKKYALNKTEAEILGLRIIETDEKKEFLFQPLADDWSDQAIGGLTLFLSLLMLCVCLFCLVKILQGILQGRIRTVMKKFVNADFPGVCAYFTGYVAIVVGAGMTILVQSSSVFTSSITPLVGIGVISLERMYPLTLGSNIGTTATGILAALAQDPEDMENPLQVALCHLFFNISGIVLFYPIPFMRFPIRLAKFLGNETAKYRWFPFVYLFGLFFLLPLAVFGLSVPGPEVMWGVLGPILFIIVVIAIIKILQAKFPRVLPDKLKNWKFLPEPMRSLAPFDRIFCQCSFCRRSDKKKEESPQELTNISVSTKL